MAPRVWQLGVAVLGCAGLGALYLIDPSDPRLPTLCPYRAVTGLACPGCGLTRCVHALLHGNVSAAFNFNPLVFVALPLMMAFAVAPGVLGESSAARWRARMAWTLLAVILAFWVWRNTPVYPLLRL
jgi:hypothetical protein